MMPSTMNTVKAISRASSTQRSQEALLKSPKAAPKFLMWVRCTIPGRREWMPVFSSTWDTVQNFRN